MPVFALGSDNGPLAVRFLGGLQVRQNGTLLPRPLPTRKTTALFAFLLLHPHAEHSRDFLAGTFWPDVPRDDALRSLSQALVAIRRLVEPLPEQKGRVLVSPRDAVCLIPPADWWVDVWAFRHARTKAQEFPVGSPEWFAVLEEAVSLYGGDLPGEYGEEWCLPLREELQQQFVGYLHSLAHAEEQRGQYHPACAWARRALSVDPCHEESYRSLMRLYYWLGEHARAIHQYQECRQALLEELDEPPSPETIALYERLKQLRKQPRPAPSPSPISDLPDLMGPMVGRDRELQRLRRGWDRAQASRGELLLLTGEAGIGKSRLGRQLIQDVALDGGLALVGQASALESSFLYRPLIYPLRRTLELAAQHGLRLPAPVWMAQVARLLPEVQPGDGSVAVPEGESSRLLEEGLAQLLLTLAEQRPLCLFLDDLQWADAATGRFLCYLARQSEQRRVLLIAAYREGEVSGSDWLGSWVTEVQAQRMATSLPLARLNEEEVATLLKQLAEDGASDALLRPLGARLHQETEGNPLFLLQTVRLLFDRGYLTRTEEGRWRIASERVAQSVTAGGTSETESGQPLAWRLPIPETVQRVVRQRVSRLGEEDRQLLQCAAVIGRRFTFQVLQRAVGWAMEPTLECLERLLAADLISAHAHPAAFDFRHDKIREVVYEDLLSVRQQEWHRRVGEALETIYNVAGRPESEEPHFPLWFRPPPPPDRAQAEEHAEELAWQGNPLSSGFTEAAQQCVMVVEDEAMLREMLRDLLGGEGYAVECVANGQEALDRLQAGVSPCLILLDLMLPVLDGWEFRKRQRQHPRLAGIPVVVISGAGSPQDQVAALAPAAYFEKPFSVQSLLELIEAHCRCLAALSPRGTATLQATVTDAEPDCYAGASRSVRQSVPSKSSSSTSQPPAG